MKNNIKLFEDFEDEDDENTIDNHALVQKDVSAKLGKPFSTNADWGGANVWLLRGESNFVGTFLYQGDDEVVVLNRVFNDAEEENVDTVLKTFTEKDDLDAFVDGYLKAKGSNSIDQFLEKNAVNESRTAMKHVKLFESFGKPARKGRFMLDDENSYEGYTFDEDWNGFECPYFEKEVADQIMKDMSGTFEDDAYKFDGSEDFAGQEIDTNEGKKKVWAIGAYSWTWTE